MNDTAESVSSFRVIIVGSGPVGLIAANALGKAGIDYLILERRKVADVNSGASLAVWSHSSRILDQLGLLDEALATYISIKKKRNLLRNGLILSDSTMVGGVEVNHGHPWMLYKRQTLVDMLHQAIGGDNAKILYEKDVTSLDVSEGKVTITCGDSTTYSGSVVIGADGANSGIRRLMKASVQTEHSKASKKVDNPYETSYRYLVCSGDVLPTLAAETIYETHGDNFLIQTLVGENMMFFTIFERYKQGRPQTKFSPEETEAMANSYSDVRITDSVTLGEIWKAKHWSHLSVVSEGMVDQWYGDRVVLVGDAVTTMSPSSALGMNTGIQGVVEIVNRLRSLLQKDPNPSTATLSTVFEAYQKARWKTAKDAVFCSYMQLRICSWSNGAYKFVDRYIASHLNFDMVALNHLMSPVIKLGITLDFLEEKSFKSGRIPWVNGARTLNAP